MSPANLMVTGLTLLAVLLARRGLGGLARRSDVARRLRTLYTLLALLLALRLLSAFTSGALLAVATMVVAAWLPFAGLRLVEELIRRHALKPVKLLALGGAIGFTLVAVSVGLLWSAAAIAALAAFQLAMLILMAVMLWRSRDGLSLADRQFAGAILTAFLLAVPLIVTDFEALFPGFVVRGGAFAILLLVLATASATREARALRRFVADVLLLLFAAGIAWLAADLTGIADPFPISATIAALAGLLLLTERIDHGPDGTPDLIASLARADGGRREALLAAHPLLATGRLIGMAELADVPPASVAALVTHRVVTPDCDNPEVAAAARELLLANGATHLLRLEADPPLLLAVAAGELAGPDLDDELRVAARLLETSP